MMAGESGNIISLESETDSEDRQLLESWLASNKSRPQSQPTQQMNTTSAATVGNHSRSRNHGIPNNLAQRQQPSLKEKQPAQRKEKTTANHTARRKNVGEGVHQRRKGDKRSEIQILVSAALFQQKKSSCDVLKVVRDWYASQIIVCNDFPANRITWRRIKENNHNKPNNSSEESVGISLFVFSAEEFLDHITYRTLDKFTESLMKDCKERVIYCVAGMEKECAKRARLASQSAEYRVVISKRAVQDCYTHLYMEHRIQVRDLETVDEAADYVNLLTDTIAIEPYHKASNLLDSSLRYRQSSKDTNPCTMVVSNIQLENQSQMQAGSDPESDDAVGADASIAPRMESQHELGHVYSSFLTFIPGMSADKARSIRSRYRTLHELLTAYNACQSPEEQEMMLANITYGRNSRRVGPKLSESIAKVMLSTDPTTIL